MKQDALVISLEPFVAGGGTERGRHERNLERVYTRLPSYGRLVRVRRGGTFYLHRVDRAGYAGCALASKRRGGASRGVKDDLIFFSVPPLYFC